MFVGMIKVTLMLLYTEGDMDVLDRDNPNYCTRLPWVYVDNGGKIVLLSDAIGSNWKSVDAFCYHTSRSHY